MKILVVSNYYPPYYIGGYELGCCDVVEELKKRGHEVLVLTSTYGSVGEAEPGILRQLTLRTAANAHESEIDAFKSLLELENKDQHLFLSVCGNYNPDVVYFWNMRSISLSPVFLAQQLGLRVSFFVSDHWLAEWETDGWYTRCRTIAGRRNKLAAYYLRWLALKSKVQMFAGLELDLTYTQFCSEFLKQAAVRAGKQVRSAQVIHWGVHPERFPCSDPVAPPNRLLYVGQLVPHKGIHTAIESLYILVHKLQFTHLTLTIVGGSEDETYKKHLYDLVKQFDLDGYVGFEGVLSRQKLLGAYQDHGILICPSIWEEPFAITPLEGMCAGLVVVGTTTGGSLELFEAGVNALTFAAEDAQECARQLARVLQLPSLYEQLRQAGHKTITQCFTMKYMVDIIEQTLAKQQEA